MDEPIELGPTNIEDLYCELGPTNTEDLYRGGSGGSDMRDANKMRIGRKKGKLDATAREEEESSDGETGERIQVIRQQFSSASATESQSEEDLRSGRGSQSEKEERSTLVGRSLDMDEIVGCSNEKEAEKIISFEKEKRHDRW
ncbi:hypothetical protein AAC387_Pa04g1323 [Persea americana]